MPFYVSISVSNELFEKLKFKLCKRRIWGTYNQYDLHFNPQLWQILPKNNASAHCYEQTYLHC